MEKSNICCGLQGTYVPGYFKKGLAVTAILSVKHVWRGSCSGWVMSEWRASVRACASSCAREALALEPAHRLTTFDSFSHSTIAKHNNYLVHNSLRRVVLHSDL